MSKYVVSTQNKETRLEKEFKRLKKRYKLKKTKLAFSKQIVDVKCAQGCFFHEYNLIIMPDRRFSKAKLLTLLHEICHAIQHQEKRFVIPKNHTRRRYAQEIEAELFAIKEYGKIYSKKLGEQVAPNKTYDHWQLASYQIYRSDWISPKYKKPQSGIDTLNQIAGFVKTLNDEDKKPIEKIIKSFKP